MKNKKFHFLFILFFSGVILSLFFPILFFLLSPCFCSSISSSFYSLFSSLTDSHLFFSFLPFLLQQHIVTTHHNNNTSSQINTTSTTTHNNNNTHQQSKNFRRLLLGFDFFFFRFFNLPLLSSFSD
ncbi:hypothetical protein MtrunA17_Chr6g0463881 [Medicago truncatula]|uniref:Transmembrane protein n=1 Tax=Medicago truncatula TaxID=3880 RepID=A0A396HGS6_MEDTR|nr:hypothetical protein MtrunA17_Chr6g0463881 [Medicago truncatula]